MKTANYVSPQCEVVRVCYESAILQGSSFNSNVVSDSYDNEDEVAW